ncbi:carbohydrate ABC transporter permease [Bacillus sp. AFS041924]|uniref:carbohydrate ABC transporter permease n=1 Tax=Bacillus sp. AFS041924 TaxID=2033503 RepID=UPI000BFC0B73|nr:carbohydrate ABC transporter permease [Bacillus sp. AFS041924]PGS53864.1 sugar ABC transporter permease [Bacillus sp. AFS041924]
MRRNTLIRKWILTFFLLCIAAMMVFPIVFTLSNSFMTEKEISQSYPSDSELQQDNIAQKVSFVHLDLIPEKFSFEQYKGFFDKKQSFIDKEQSNMKFYGNSVLMVFPIILGQLIVASLAAYVFGKLKFKGRDPLFLVYMVTMLMPFQVTLVPNYIIADKLGLLNSFGAIIFPGVFGAFGVFMLRQFVMTIPYSIVEAAKIDGAGHFKIFIKIILPLIRPGLAALVVLLFADYWNMVEQPLIFLDDPSKFPLSLYLSQIIEETRGISFAASILYMAPMLLIFVFTKKYLIKGIQLSGAKD